MVVSSDSHSNLKRGWAETELQREGRKRWRAPQKHKTTMSSRTTLKFLPRAHHLGMKTQHFSKKDYGVGWEGGQEWGRRRREKHSHVNCQLSKKEVTSNKRMLSSKELCTGREEKDRLVAEGQLGMPGGEDLGQLLCLVRVKRQEREMEDSGRRDTMGA